MARDGRVEEKGEKEKRRDTYSSVRFSAAKERKRGWSRLISKRNERKSGRQTTASRKNLETLTNLRVDSSSSLSLPLSSTVSHPSKLRSVSPFLCSSFNTDSLPFAGASYFPLEEQSRADD